MASKRRRKRKKRSFFDTVDYSSFELIAPRCPHFGECGGCTFQNLSLDDQLSLKKTYLDRLFDQDVSVTANPAPYGYRTRMDFVYAHGKLGLRKKGDFSTVIDITECHLLPPALHEVFLQVRSLLTERDIPSYDFLAHEGFLRYVVLRHAPGTGQIMVIFSTAACDDEAILSRFRAMRREIASCVTSVYWLVNDSMTDTSIIPDSTKEVFGAPVIEDVINDTSLAISPYSFYQTNIAVTKLIFSRINEFVKGNVVDLCCGVGAIGLFVASQARSLTGIELVGDAVALARQNAASNDIDALFFEGDMKILDDIAPLEIDTLIVDPPRSGLSKKTIDRILSLAPDRIIYMSCNPKTQKLDRDALTVDGQYEQIFLEGYDMFTHTPHVESLLVLDHILSS
ncbi:MAG: 23S rRNA (uracil(1939)-C(5))-methyltransferase RlmD [Nanoarchaeota archaeon]